MFVRVVRLRGEGFKPTDHVHDSSSANRFAGDRKALLLRWSPYSDWYAN